MKSKKNNNRETNNIGNKTTYILLLVIIGITIAIILAFYTVYNNNNKTNDGLVYNKNKSFIKTQKVKGILFKDIKCSYDGKNSLISYTITNVTKDNIYLNNYDIIVKNKNKIQLTKIAADITQTLEPNKSVQMANQVVEIDLTDAYYMELKLNTNKNKKDK